jgi:hypothetical protein
MPLELAITFGALWWYARVRRPATPRVIVLTVVLLALQAVNWFGPVETEVTVGTSLLAFAAFGLAALTAGWMGKSARLRRLPVPCQAAAQAIVCDGLKGES